MEITYGDTRSVRDWLKGQEAVIRLWINELITDPGCAPETVATLEAHENWIRDRLDELS